MPVYDPDHVEYSITDGMIRIALDDGGHLPAYWAHPTLGTKFPGIVLIHDWWGLTTIVRRMANLLAQMGHYVIAPDLFRGEVAHTPQQAMALLEQTQAENYTQVNHALKALEHHHHCNKTVAAIGIGMGGSLAYEAAIRRPDLEAAVVFSGFPHRFIGKFAQATTPICAFYGEQEPHIKPDVIQKMRDEMLQSEHSLDHEIHIVPQIAHDFFVEDLPPHLRDVSRTVLKTTLEFLDKHLKAPGRRGDRMTF
jgi:carboxymethylenebutenolidase